MGIDPVGVNESNIHSFNRYAYANNNPYKYVDPDGRAVETVWDVANLAMGVASFGANLNAGNYAGAGLDAAGIIVDTVATAIPVVPGGAGATIKAYRAADTVHANSKLSEKAQHLYEIYRTNPDGTETVLKTGISSGKTTVDGESSYRATRQINDWVKEGKASKGELQQRIVDRVEAGPGAREKALGLEISNAQRLRSEGQLDENFHQRP